MTIRVYRYFDSVVVTPDGATVESYLSPMQAEELAAQLLRYAEDVRQSPSLDGIRGAADIGADSKPAPRYERDSKGEIIEQGKVATARPAGGGRVVAMSEEAAPQSVFVVTGEHYSEPGTNMRVFTSEREAEAYAKELTVLIGDGLVEREVMSDMDGANDIETEWNLAKANDWEAAMSFLQNQFGGDNDFYVVIDELEVEGRPTPPADLPGYVVPPYIDARFPVDAGELGNSSRMCRLDLLAGYQRLHDGLSDMIEGGRLEECDIPDDYQWLCDSLEKLSGIEHAGSAARRVVECAADNLAKAEPLPTALHMLHMIADGADNAPTLAVYAIRALQRIVAASVDLHAALGEAMETHIYNFDNGDTIPADCQFQKALDALTSAFQGSPHSYVTPALPTPWIMAYGADRVTLVSEPTGGEVLPVINNPTDAHLRTVQFIMETANAARALPVKKEA